MTETSAEERSLLERALGLFTEVRAGEGVTALLLALNVFVLLTAYYIVKPVREALILALDSGAEYKAYMSAVIAAALLVLVPIYARFVDRVPKLKLVVGATLFFASHLVLFWLASQSEAIRRHLGLVFYVWVGIFNMMVVAQFWAYANDVYDPERGKRLFPLIALGASWGAALGAKVAALLIPLFGEYGLLLASAGLLVCCALLFLAADRGRSQPSRSSAGPAPDKGTMDGAFALVLKHRYLLLLAGFSLVFSWVNTNGEYMLSKLVKGAASAAVNSGEILAADQGKYIGSFYGDFFFYVNVLGVLLQSFVVSRIIKYGGLGVAFFIFPFIALGSSLAILAVPLLYVARIGKIAENATDYSLNNTVRQTLWLPTSEAMKYKAKQAVDTFFVRMGDVSSALLVAIGAGMLSLPVRAFAVANALLIAVWLVFAIAIVRENRVMTSQAKTPSAS